MVKLKYISLFVSFILLSSFAVSHLSSWQITDDYSIIFRSSKASGSFTKFKGEIDFNEEHLSMSRFDVEIEVASIKTGNFLKNSHAKGKKWFHAKEYPTINYASNSFEKTASGYEVTGTLSMHGVERELTIPFTFVNEIFESTFMVDRTEYKIGATTGLAKNVPHDISLTIRVPVTRGK